jgi:hypothetical protein
MGKLTPRRIAAGVALALVASLGVWVAASHTLRDRIAAGARGFRDPSRVRPAFEDGTGDPALPPATELEQPDVGLDFEKATTADFGDAGTLDELTLPDLGIPISKRTTQFVAYFAAGTEGRKAFIERFRRGGRYRERIEQALRDVGAPEDLVWLVGIESAFNPQAVSPKGAVGLFQFMPETGAKYGLAIDTDVDDRRGILKATAAGTQHLHDLFDHYGRWDLAIAAYNFGMDPLDEAIAKLRARRGEKNAGKPVEFKDLAEGHFIPKETANFVPQVQAFAIVAANRGRFGLDDLDVMPPFEFGEMAVPGGTPLKVVAKAAGVSIATMRDYNPDLLRDHAPNGGDALVLVPADKLDRATAAFAAIYAREVPNASGSGVAEAPRAPAERASGAPSASAAAPPSSAPAEPASDRFTLDDGINIELRPASGGSVTIASRVELMEPTRAGGLRATGEGFDVAPVTVAERDLARGLDRAAAGIARIDRGAGEAARALRRRVGAATRRTLEKAPYGAGWLALGDTLFPEGSALAGTVLVSPLQPIASIVMVEEPRGAMRITVKIDGPSKRGEVAAAAKRAFAVLDASAPEVTPPAKVARVTATSGITSPRFLYGWIAPPGGDAAEPALRLALVLLAHNQHGRLAHTLVQRGIAAHVKGTLDLGEGASVASLEIDAAVPHDENDIERALDAELDAAAAGAPSANDLVAAKDVLRAILRSERGRARAGEPRETAAARVDALARKADDVSPDEVRAVTKKVFVPERRVIVTITPRR